MKKTGNSINDRFVKTNIKSVSDIELFSFDNEIEIKLCTSGISKDIIEQHIKKVTKAYLFDLYKDYNKLIESRNIVFVNELCLYELENKHEGIVIDEFSKQMFKVSFYNAEIKRFNKIRKLQKHNDLVNVSLKRYVDFCKGIINPIEKPQKQLIGFKTTLKKPQQTKLYKALQNNNYIDCTEPEFKAMFTDNPQPIKWLKSNALLSFFVHDLFQKENDTNYWHVAESIFINESNNPITSLRQSFITAYNNKNKKPKGYKELKNIYSHLL